MKTIKELRQAGFKVKVHHYRYFPETVKFSDNTLASKFVLKPNNFNDRPYEKGGLTEIEVCAPDGTQLGFGTSKCFLSDNFNRKRGVNIALGRALSNTDKV